MPPLDLQFVASSIVRGIRALECKLVRHEDLISYYENHNLDPQEILEDCATELEDIFAGDLHKCVKTKDLNGLTVQIHRILGVARHMFADKLIATCCAYNDALSMIKKRDPSRIKGDMGQLIVTMNLLLRQVLSESIGAINCPRNQRVRSHEQRRGDFTSMGMRRIISLSDDETDQTTEEGSIKSHRK